MIRVKCPGCGKTIKAPNKYAGKRAKCPGCNSAIQIPAAATGAAKSATLTLAGPRPCPHAESPEPTGDALWKTEAREAWKLREAEAEYSLETRMGESLDFVRNLLLARLLGVCLGLGVVLPGLFMVAVGLGNLLNRNGSLVVQPVIAGLVLATFGAAVFAYLFTYREGTTINRRTCSMVKWRKSVFSLQEEHQRISAIEGVSLGREVRRRGAHEYEVVVVRLVGRDEQGVVEEHLASHELNARKQGEQLARFLDVPLTDTTAGGIIIRTPAQLDQSLRDRVRQESGAPSVPHAPAGTRLKCIVEGNGLRISIPRLRPFISLSQIGVLAMGISGGLYLLFFPHKLAQFYSDDPVDFWMYYGFATLMLVGSLFYLREEQVAVCPSHLRVVKRYLLGRTTKEIRAEQLEELLVHESKGITARSDHASVEFGAGLDAQELRWLHAAIQSTLAS